MPTPIRKINPDTLAAPPGYSQVVETQGGRTIYIAGQVALDEAGVLVGPNDVAAQAAQVFENLRRALAAVGGDFTHVVKLTTFVTDVATALPAYRQVIRSAVAEPRPASTFVEVRRLFRDEFLIETEAVAVLPVEQRAPAAP
jgi:enamine deaminase RidA (YjgF/YER057c/UK114 family)